MAENDLTVAFKDAFPINPRHTLIVPRRHVEARFELIADEQAALWRLLPELKQRFDARHLPAGYNVGEAAGQTVGHARVHLIPRYAGDVESPRGGVRWVVLERA